MDKRQKLAGRCCASACADGNTLNVTTQNRIQGLVWDGTQPTASYTFTATPAAGQPTPPGYAWSIDGTFVAYTGANNTYTAQVHGPGQHLIECQWMAPPMYFLHGSSTFYSFGGPLSIDSSRSFQPRETLLNSSLRFQPFILEDYSGGSQAQNSITASPTTGQPGTTTYSWDTSGPITRTSTQGLSTAAYTATGASGRGGAFPILTYTVTIEGAQYSITDATDPQYKAISCHRPADCRFDPSDTVTSQTKGPPTWTYTNQYLLYIVSNIGDPFWGVRFQERYLDPYYLDGGNQITGTDPNAPGMTPGITWNATTGAFWRAGRDQSLPVNKGFNYNAKDSDFNGISGLPLNVPRAQGLELYQRIFGATTSTIPNDPGIFLRRFTIDMWSTGVDRS